MLIRHSIKELLAKSMDTRPMKCIVVGVHEKQIPPIIVMITQIIHRFKSSPFMTLLYDHNTLDSIKTSRKNML